MVKVCLFYGVDLRGKTMADASRRGGTFPCWRRSIWRGQICRGGARRLHQCWIFFPVAWRSRQIAGRIAGRLLQHRSSGRTLPEPRSTGPPSTSTSPTSTTKTATTSTNHRECVQGAVAKHQEATLLTTIPSPGFPCLPCNGVCVRTDAGAQTVWCPICCVCDVA